MPGVESAEKSTIWRGFPDTELSIVVDAIPVHTVSPVSERIDTKQGAASGVQTSIVAVFSCCGAKPT